VCSKGTYIRTLCHDIGAALGCGGTLAALRRIRAGVYSVDMAHTLDDVLSAISTGKINGFIQPVDSIFPGYPSVSLDEGEVKKAKNGALCNVPENTQNGTYKVYTPDGEFLMLANAESGILKTIKNFFEVNNE